MAFMRSDMASKIVMSSLLWASILQAAVDASASELKVYTIGTSDFDAQMSGIKFWKNYENLRPVNKNLFFGILSGCLHFGLFSSLKVHNDSTMRLNKFIL